MTAGAPTSAKTSYGKRARSLNLECSGATLTSFQFQVSCLALIWIDTRKQRNVAAFPAYCGFFFCRSALSRARLTVFSYSRIPSASARAMLSR